MRFSLQAFFSISHCGLDGESNGRQRSKAFFQISDDIVDMLRADGEADSVRADPLVKQLLLRKLGVGRGSRMDHQTLDVRHIGQQRKQLQTVNKTVRLPDIAPDLECKDGAAAFLYRESWGTVIVRYNTFAQTGNLPGPVFQKMPSTENTCLS